MRSCAGRRRLRRSFAYANHSLVGTRPRGYDAAEICSEEAFMAGWRIEGQYMETCNCNFLCPCITSNLTARPSEGDCKAAIAMRIDKGEKDGVKLNGLSFIVLMHSPKAMAEGNITVGLIVYERASVKYVEAI